MGWDLTSHGILMMVEMMLFVSEMGLKLLKIKYL